MTSPVLPGDVSDLILEYKNNNVFRIPKDAEVKFGLIDYRGFNPISHTFTAGLWMVEALDYEEYKIIIIHPAAEVLPEIKASINPYFSHQFIDGIMLCIANQSQIGRTILDIKLEDYILFHNAYVNNRSIFLVFSHYRTRSLKIARKEYNVDIEPLTIKKAEALIGQTINILYGQGWDEESYGDLRTLTIKGIKDGRRNGTVNLVGTLSGEGEIDYMYAIKPDSEFGIGSGMDTVYHALPRK